MKTHCFWEPRRVQGLQDVEMHELNEVKKKKLCPNRKQMEIYSFSINQYKQINNLQ
jgi:hypothetical protein